MKETVKKLIYALEQLQLTKQTSTAPTAAISSKQNLVDFSQRPSSFANRTNFSRGGVGALMSSIADSNFGVTANSILPSVNENSIISNQ